MSVWALVGETVVFVSLLSVCEYNKKACLTQQHTKHIFASEKKKTSSSRTNQYGMLVSKIKYFNEDISGWDVRRV